MLDTKKILLIGGKHIQDHEFFYPFYRISEESDFVLTIATPLGEPCETNKGTRINPDLALEAVDVKNYDGLIIPGGALAIEYLRQNKSLIALTKEFNGLRKAIASICQGSQILISAKAVSGRTVSGYYSIRDDIENAGGIYQDSPAVIDRNLVTTAHYKDMGPWMHEFIKKVRSQKL